MKSLVSVCLPMYNGSQFLKEALDSIGAQTYPNMELIVSDDASSDHGLEIVSRFRESVTFPVKIFKHTPQGIGANWNHCLEKASGIYIKYVFQDDILEPTCIEEMVGALENNSRLGLISCKRSIIVEEGSDPLKIQEWKSKYGNLQKQLEPNYFKDVLLTKDVFKRKDFFKTPLNKIGEPSLVLFRKSIVEEVGYFNEDLKQDLDYEFWYRILRKYDILILGRELASFRIHLNQATSVNELEGADDSDAFAQILYNDFLPYLHTDKQKELKLKFDPFFKWKFRLKQRLGKLVKK
ncbi:MAG: glycosyltransferase [Nonlabens sp.]